jgi:hypothetical protein
MLQLKYAKKEEIPQGKEDLYTEKDGAFHFTGVDGLKTQADIDRMTVGLTKERDDHKVTKGKLQAWEGLERADVDTKLARLAELEITTTNSVPKVEMDRRLDELTEVRVKNRLVPVEREREALKVKLAETEKRIVEYQARENQRTVHDKVRAAAVTAKVQPEVMTDVLLLADNVFQLTEQGELLTKENAYGVDAGLTADNFFQTQQEKRPYWWPAAVGGGSKGSGNKGNGGAANPWTAETWNLTAQGAYVKANGMEKAQQLAKIAGTTVGGKPPAVKKS